MVVTLNISHLFKYPVELVIKTYINKHESPNQLDAVKVEESSSHQEGEMTCLRRQLTLANYFPKLFRKVECLKRDNVIVEEEIWSQAGENRHWIRYHDKTWDGVEIGKLTYLSKYEGNSNWSLWEQDAVIDLGVFGLFGTVMELYLKRTFTNSAKSEIKLMESLMAKGVMEK